MNLKRDTHTFIHATMFYQTNKQTNKQSFQFYWAVWNKYLVMWHTGDRKKRGQKKVIGYHVWRKKRLRRMNSNRIQACRSSGVPLHPQILADQVTLSQPGRQTCPPHYHWHPRIFRRSYGPGIEGHPVKLAGIEAKLWELSFSWWVLSRDNNAVRFFSPHSWFGWWSGVWKGLAKWLCDP